MSIVRRLTDHLPELTIPDASLNPFLVQFRSRHNTVCREEWLGGLGYTPCLKFMFGKELMGVPLLWNEQRSHYDPAYRNPRDHTQLLPCDMGALLEVYPALYNLSQAMYSTVR